MRAAETGRFEAIVAAAQPAEPPKMVTPEEREAELRAHRPVASEKSASPRPSYGGGREGESNRTCVWLSPTSILARRRGRPDELHAQRAVHRRALPSGARAGRATIASASPTAAA